MQKSFPQLLIFRQGHIIAVAVGTRKDAIDFLGFAARGTIKKHYTIDNIERLAEIFNEMKERKLIGRVVWDLDA